MADEDTPRGPPAWAKWVLAGAAVGGIALAMNRQRPRVASPAPALGYGAAGPAAAEELFAGPEPSEPAEAQQQLMPSALRTAANERYAEASNEPELVEALKRVMRDGGVALVAEAWQPVHNRMDMGEGDLVFRLGSNDFVVEVKFIPITTGPTARRRRTTHRAQVKEQALRYSREWRRSNPGRHVVAVTYTNDQGWVELAN